MMTRLIPNSAKTVKAYGKKSETSLSDEYDPEPDSGRRGELRDLRGRADALVTPGPLKIEDVL